MALVKLTNADGTTYGGCQWGEGVEHTAPGVGELCRDGWLHCYEADTEEDAALLAAFMNPIHGAFDLDNAILWRCEGDIGKRAPDWKVGATRLKTIVPIPLPRITTEQRVEIAIRRSLLIYAEPSYVAWAHGWLDGSDRSAWSARSAARSAEASAQAAMAAQAARAAETAAQAAAWSAAALEAEAAAWSASAAAQAAMAAAWSAAAALAAIDLVSIIRRVLSDDADS